MVEALKALHDIHMPSPINPWWPPAPGIVGLGVLAIFTTLWLALYLYSKKARQLKKIALRQLSTLESAYHAGDTAAQTAAQISMLLKQVALLFYPREEVAALKGEAWLLFLEKTSKKLDFSAARHALLHLAYHQKSETKDELSELFRLTRCWIKQRSNRCLN